MSLVQKLHALGVGGGLFWCLHRDLDLSLLGMLEPSAVDDGEGSLAKLGTLLDQVPLHLPVVGFVDLQKKKT